VVGRTETDRVKECKDDSEDGDGGGEEVRDVVPGIGLKGRARDAAAGAEFDGGEGAFQKDSEDERIQGEGLHGSATLRQRRDTVPEDSSGGEQQDGSDGKASKDFVTAMAIGMFVVGWLAGNPQARVDDSG